MSSRHSGMTKVLRQNHTDSDGWKVRMRPESSCRTIAGRADHVLARESLRTIQNFSLLSRNPSPDSPGAKPDQVVVILKARDPARIMTAIGDKVANRWHLQFAQRWVDQYNFYINDRNWGRMFVRICPYLPFSSRICLNQHHWLANRMREQGIGFKQTANAFLKCAVPERLQELANSLTPRDLVTCGQKWLAHLTPFFTAREREHAGCQHRLFFSQVEYCDNLIFRRRAALDNLGQRLLDANRTIGQPNKITVIFGRKVTKQYRGKPQTSSRTSPFTTR